MEYVIRKFARDDLPAVTSIFNYYIENTFAAYPEVKVGSGFFEGIIRMAQGYPFYVVEDRTGKVIGFALLNPHICIETFARAADISYFLLPEHTGKGLGKRLLDTVIADAKTLNIDTILASICSHNQKSIDFHLQNGFTKCAHFKSTGRKFDTDFDVIWMQKFI
jgi:L-amino acid N-acyltransferase YncA